MCRDETGILVVADNGDYAWRICDCVPRRRVQRLMKSSHITPEFQRIGFEDFVREGRPACTHRAYESAVFYAQNFERLRDSEQNSMALLGPPGTGKTRLLIAVANALLARGIGVHYFPWVEGSNDLRDAVHDSGESMKRLRDALKTVDVLYIDDLFKGRKEPTQFQLEFLFDVVNFRSLNHRPILVSSERDIDGLCDVDEGIGSRIYERCRDFTVIMHLTAQEKDRGMILNYRLAQKEV